MPVNREYETRDKPAERGITINNILLTIVVLGGGVFATIVTNLMTTMQTDVKDVKDTITAIKVQDGITSNEIAHVHEQLDRCEEFHKSVAARLLKIERKVFNVEYDDFN